MMPKISNRSTFLSESPIRKLVPFAEQAKARGLEVLQLNIGQPDIETPPQAIEAVRNYGDKVIGYSHSLGHISLREKLSKYYESQYINIGVEELIITTGGSEAIMFALGAVTDFDDEVITPEPFYANYKSMATLLGVKIKTLASTIDERFSLPNINDFERAINDKTRAIIVCNPNNPTGYLYTRTELEQLVDLAKRKNLFLLFDEVYREFVYQGKHTSIFHIEGADQIAILLDSFSKRYSMCGARVGCVATKNKAVFNVMVKMAQARLSPPLWAQIAAEAAVDTPPEYFKEVVKIYKDRRAVLVEGLQNIPGVLCPEPGGAFYCMVQLPVEDTDDFSQWILSSFEHQGKTLMVAPASGFYSDPQMGKKEIRIAYVLEAPKLKQAVNILKEALAQYTQLF